MAEQYYLDKTDACKDAGSIPGILITYVLKKSWEKNKKLELYSPGSICDIHVEINGKSFSTVVVKAPWNVLIIVTNVS